MIPVKLKKLIEKYCMGMTPTDAQMDKINDLSLELEADPDEVVKYIEELMSGPTKEEREAIAKAEAERKAKEEAERKAKAEAERKAKAEAERKAREEAERKAKVEAKKKAEIKKIVDLAEDYYYGRNGKSKDYEEAVANYLIAAEAGKAYSQYCLGWCYEKGLGVEKSVEEAEKWYRKAAEQGEKNAKERLGNILFHP